MKKNRKRIRKLKKKFSMGMTVFCLCLAGVLALLLTPIFDVENITVRGNTVVSSEDIIKAANIAKGTNTFSVSLKQVKDNVESIGTVESAKIKRILPSTVAITVKEGTPIVYIYDHGDCVGITADGRVTDVKHSSSELEEPQKKEEQPENEESDEEQDEAENAEEPEEEPAPQEETRKETGMSRAVVTGMGKITYKVGGKIKFSDKVKAENLYKLLEEFFGDEICDDVSTIDMTQYERISFTMKSGLKVYLGEATELGYKLKCFKAILSGQLDENSKGTLDLERLTYSPKNK